MEWLRSQTLQLGFLGLKFQFNHILACDLGHIILSLLSSCLFIKWHNNVSKIVTRTK